MKRITDGLDINNHIAKSVIGGGSQLGGNSNKTFKISRELTTDIMVILYDNGLINFTGIDANGDQTLSFTHVPYGDYVADCFGDNWLDKVWIAQSQSSMDIVNADEVKAKLLSLSENQYRALNRPNFSQLIASFTKVYIWPPRASLLPQLEKAESSQPETFTLYQNIILNPSIPSEIVNIYYSLDGDLNDWDFKSQYILPNGWMVKGKADQPSYLLTENNKTISADNICYSKIDEAPVTAYITENGRFTVVFKQVGDTHYR